METCGQGPSVALRRLRSACTGCHGQVLTFVDRAEGGGAMGSCSSALPDAPAESEAGVVTDVLGDGRLFADFVLYLRGYHPVQELPKLLGNLWELELDREEASASEALEAAWQAYSDHPQGLVRFDDAGEWDSHDLPAKEICEAISQPADGIDEEDKLYSFAVAAMVGIHVATVCSTIVDNDRESFVAEDDDSEDFAVQVSRRFKIPVEGSAFSPKLVHSEPFEIEEFAPTLFRKIRGLSGVSDYSYMDSLCRVDFKLIKFGSNSKSGAVFFFSHDRKFLLKSCTKGEAMILLDMLPDMIGRFVEEQHSMIGRYLGLYRITLQGHDSMLFFIMRSSPVVESPDTHVHKTYDLKGSTRHRRAKPGESVGKDLDFQEDLGRLDLAPGIAQQLVEIYEKDIDLLLQYEIMDYSLLVQIHNKSETKECVEHNHPFAHTVTVDARQSPKGSWHQRSLTEASDICKPVSQLGNPAAGIPSADESQVFFFCLIDLLVPFDAYPKAQYVGLQLTTCGNGKAASRVPPDYYHDRQKAMFRRICRVEQDTADESG